MISMMSAMWSAEVIIVSRRDFHETHGFLGFSTRPQLHGGADSLWRGTWNLREPPQGGHLTMTVEEVGTGWKLTYKIVDANAPRISM